jgi:hypothetical protein
MYRARLYRSLFAGTMSIEKWSAKYIVLYLPNLATIFKLKFLEIGMDFLRPNFMKSLLHLLSINY